MPFFLFKNNPIPDVILILNMALLLMQDRAGVTFAPHQLATYTTPNFYIGDAAAALRDASSTRPLQANHATPGMRTVHALHAAAHPQSSNSVPAKSSSSHPPLHAEPSFSHGGAFPGKRKRAQDGVGEGTGPEAAKHHAQTAGPSSAQGTHQAQQSFGMSLPSQLGPAVSASAAQVLTAGMPVQ